MSDWDDWDDCCLLWLATVIGVVYLVKWTYCFFNGLYTWLKMIVESGLRRRNFAEEYGGKWAVVTGSTDGIGKEYARQLAQRGMNIVLVSRTPEKLKRVEEEIKKEYGVETHTIAADFNNGRQIYDGIAKGLEGKDIGILVNNVGYFGPEPQMFNDVSEDDMWRIVTVNVSAVVGMTKIVLPQMLARRRGAIINMSSIVAVCPSPKTTLYSASKAFVTFFSRALEYEYRDSGLTVQVLQPGVVTTNMASYTERFSKPDAFMTPSPPTLVTSALSTIGHRKVIAGTWDHELLTFLVKLMPEEMYMRGYMKFGNILDSELSAKKAK